MSVNRLAETFYPSWIRPMTSVWRGGEILDREAVRHLRLAFDAVSFLANSLAVAALALGLWRLAGDLNLAGNFFIGQGLFSHWQVWIALAMGLKFGHVSLDRTLARVPEGEPRARS
jgi:formate hydrogenlyase subunit 4